MPVNGIRMMLSVFAAVMLVSPTDMRELTADHPGHSQSTEAFQRVANVRIRHKNIRMSLHSVRATA